METINAFISSMHRRNLSPLTINKYDQIMRDFVELVGIAEPGQIDDDRMDVYVDHRKDLTASTLAFHINSIKRFCKFCERRGIIGHSKIADYPVPKFSNALRRPLSIEQQEAILDYHDAPDKTRTDHRNSCYFAILLLTGLRLNEARTLRVGNVSDKAVRVVDGKGRRSRSVPMLPRCWKFTDIWIRCLPSIYRRSVSHADWLFPSDRNDEPVCRNAFHRAYDLMRSDLRLTGSTIHTMRHTYAYWLLQSGASLKHIQDLLGHSSLQSTQVYLQLFPADTADAAYKHPLAN